MKNRGFTLLEVLVAVSILATAIVAIVMLFSGSLRNIKASEDNLDLAIRASTEINMIVAQKVLEEKDELVEKDGYVIQRKIKEILVDRTEALPYRLFKITVEVKKDGKLYKITTEKAVLKTQYEQQ